MLKGTITEKESSLEVQKQNSSSSHYLNKYQCQHYFQFVTPLFFSI